MRCHETSSALIEVELALASPELRAALESHLAVCSGCAARAAHERGLTADLRSLRLGAPFATDVTARVNAEIARLDPRAHEAYDVGRMAGSVAAVVVFGAALLAGLWRVAPEAWVLAGEMRRLLGGAWLAAENLATPVASVLVTLARASGGLLASLGPLLSRLEPLQPVALATIAACALMMVSSIVLVVGRDLMRPRWIREESR